ncbi:MAG: beta-L-arabinofuranosidase domain-containing protein [Bacteroidales bacterium]
MKSLILLPATLFTLLLTGQCYSQTAQGSPDHPPVVYAGPDRTVMSDGKTYLTGKVRSVTPLSGVLWTKKSGPGSVKFENERDKTTTASFSATGDYILTLSAFENGRSSASELTVKVDRPPEEARLDVVYTKRYRIDSPLWNARAKALIVNWIPWCIDQINRTDLKLGEGGLDNFIEAGKALRGEPHGKHKGYVFSNAWVHQTVESMCIALMIDPQGDREIIAAREKMKATLEKWIPVILAAQEPDGYLQTAYTLRDTAKWKSRWAPETRGNHEGYVSGYFLESAINHYTLTEGKDRRLYNAAKKLADCWVANIGPGKREWYDGHQEMEQALVRFGRFVNDLEGAGHGDNYIKLAKYLLDCRNGGTEYDQSHVPVQQQYEAVGHAVRAAYSYSAMSDVAAETGDVDYQSAVMSLWDNLVNKRYYITGGIGSGETSEGFGPDYSLGNDSYCESCSSCGLIFFQHKMNLAYHDAKYADLYEETMYNALLGSLSQDGKNFYYDNPLNSGQSRYKWHVCPCCVGNIPRTLLMIPTWTYVKDNDGIYVNLFIGSTIEVEKVAGTNVEMTQKTDYPWNGRVSITVNPEQAKDFSIFIRVPDRSTSALYTAVPAVNGIKGLKVNGKTVNIDILKGYAVIKRSWKNGDRIDFEIPMEVQRVTADERIPADRNRVALRYGPMVYNVEKADQPDIDKYIGVGPLSAVWKKDMLGGVMTIQGKWDDGTPLVAVPNFLRNNRNPVQSTEAPEKEHQGDGSIVWIRTR